MKKSVIIIIIVIATIIIAGIYQLTGFHTIPGGEVVGKCIDSDNGMNIFEKGITKYTNRDKTYEDYCIQPGKLREHWCFARNMLIRAKTKRCSGECKDGACVK